MRCLKKVRRAVRLVTVVSLAGLPGRVVAEAPRDKTVLVYPAAAWKTRTPTEAGLDRAKLDALAGLVGGRGCVVRHGFMVYTWGDVTTSGDVASVFKPVLTTLLLLAIQEGKLKSVDDRVADFEPRLRDLNKGKSAAITWRHLASQTSGYGLTEAPGQAYGYNDYALAFYYDLLTRKVFQDDGTHVLKTRLADVLQFQDRYTFEAFGPKDRPGRLAVSVRDLARFGLLWLRGGRWQDRQLLQPELVKLAISSPVAADLPLAGPTDGEMLLGQRTVGGGRRITAVGPGYYSFNWWLNRAGPRGRLFVDAPADAFVASGHGGERMLWVLPGLDLVVCWNDARIDDQDASPGNAKTKCNQAARLIRAAVLPKEGKSGPAPFRPQTRVSLVGNRWHVNGQVTYPRAKAEGLLLNVRLVNAVFEDRWRPDLDPEANTDRCLSRLADYAAHGVRAISVNLQGGFPGYEGALNSAFNPDGSLRSAYLKRVGRLIVACDRIGVVVILGCFYQRQDQILKDEAAVVAGLAHVARWVKESGFTNVVLEVANEFPHAGFDHPILRTSAGQVRLLGLARRAAPGLLVSTSGLGDGRLPAEVARSCDFLLIHLNGVPVKEIPQRLEALRPFGKAIVCNEDSKTGQEGARAAEVCVAHGVSWGLMHERLNQHYPFTFRGAADDPAVYAKLKELAAAQGP
jgi:CubicO group peptidase (beta-lactamase class C family)